MGPETRTRRFADGTTMPEDAVQRLLDATADAAAAAGVSTGVLFALRPEHGTLDQAWKDLARIEARIAARWLHGTDAAGTLAAVTALIAADGDLSWGPGTGAAWP